MLKTNRLALRAAQQSDLDDLFAIYGNARAMKYWSTPPNKTRSETQTRIDYQVIEAKSRLVYFVMVYEDRVIGQCGMHGKNEFGFILHPNYWRQGFVSEASKAIIPYLFDNNEIDELTADVDPLNLSSLAALNSLGFKETHRAKNTFCINGVWSDSIYFSLPRPKT